MRWLLSILSSLLFLGLFLGIFAYIASRTSFFFTSELYSLVFWSAIFLIFLIVFSSIRFSMSGSKSGHYLHVISSVLFGFLTYLLFATLFIDIVNLFIEIDPFLNGMIAFSLAGFVTIYGLYRSYHTEVSHLEIPIKGLVRPIRVMHLTDIHLGHHRGHGFLKKVVDLTNAENPELVFITGDLFDAHYGLNESTLNPFEALKVPWFFIEGNHDRYVDVRGVKKLVRGKGGIVLENEVHLREDLQIIGLNHMRADSRTANMHASQNGPTIQSVLEELDHDKRKPTILLHHSPDGETHAEVAGVDLYLAGHTHGGQMFPATLFASRIFKYNRGLHYFKDMAIYVCLGAGTFGPPLRVGTFSEITVVNLVPGRIEQ